MFDSSSAIRIFLRISGFPQRHRRPRRHGQAERQRERERGALAGAALDPELAAEMADDLTRDRQAEPGALRLTGESIADLPEFLENDFLVLGVDAGSVVPHVHTNGPRIVSQPDLDFALFLVAELGGVRKQVEHDLHQAVAVRENGGRALERGRDPDVPVLEKLAGRNDRVGDDLPHVDIRVVPLRIARFELGEIEHLIDEAGQPLRLLDDDAEEAFALLEVELGTVLQDLGERPDRRERRAQLVRHRRDEVVLHAIELLEPAVCFAQLVRRRLELAGLLLELTAVGEHLRGFVDDAEHFVEPERLFLDDRGEHHARRRAADRACEQRFDVMHERGVGVDGVDGRDPLRGCVGGERFLRALGSEEAAQQVREVAHGGAAAPEPGAAGGGGGLQGVHEERRLAVVRCAQPLAERDPDVEADVREHAPEQAMRDVVEARQSEKLLRLEQGHAEKPIVQERDRQPARFRERRQEQRVDPDQKARGQPARGAEACTRLSSRCRR